MSDAFNDMLDNGDNTVTTVEDTDTSSTDGSVTDHQTTQFSDAGVRTTLPDDGAIRDDRRYQDPHSENAADDVDPRALFRNVTLTEIRYYAREHPYGKPIVRKPVEDIFRHGFDVVGDNTERDDDEQGRIGDFLDEYKEYYQQAEKKSRRDGMAVLMHQIGDSADSVAEPIPDEGGEFRGFQLWTVDNLSDELSDWQVAKHTAYEQDQIFISEGAENGGIAIVDDIGHEDHGQIVGYGIAPRQESEDVQSVYFVHADRCQHFVWDDHVDGELGNNLTGKHVGESVLTPVLQPLKTTHMGFWSMKNILFRYSAPLHAVEPPESWGPDEWDEFMEDFDNVSMNSDAVLPPGAELNVAEAVSEFDPSPIFEVSIKAVCAGTEFTKPVLEGVQAGTVTGSETSLKGYYNEIQNLRTERTEEKFRQAVRDVASYDQSMIPRVANVDGFEIDWGPLFKPTDVEKAEGMVSIITAATNGIKNYVLTPNEARNLVEMEWAEFDTDIDLDDLSEDDMDTLDRINLNEAGQGIKDNEPVNGENVRQNPNLKNGGGQPQGQTRSSSQPQRSADSMNGDAIDAIADRVVEKLTEEPTDE